MQLGKTIQRNEWPTLTPQIDQSTRSLLRAVAVRQVIL